MSRAGSDAAGLPGPVAFCLRFGAQTFAYLFMLTDRYPEADPALPEAIEPAPPNPVRLALADDPKRSRLTVFFRLILALPHLVWLALWGIAVIFALIANWAITVVQGHPPVALHRFLSAYLRYAVHVYAYIALVCGPFPPDFTGRPGSYPIDVELPPPGPQGRWGVGFRLVLAVPALAVNGALGAVLVVAAILCWFASLYTGREPLGLQRLGAMALRYHAQTSAPTCTCSPSATPTAAPSRSARLRRRRSPSPRRARCSARGGPAARRASPARRSGRARARRSGRPRGSSRGGGR